MKLKTYVMCFLSGCAGLAHADQYFGGNIGMGGGPIIENQLNSINIGDANAIVANPGYGGLGNIVIGNDSYIEGAVSYSILLGGYNYSNVSSAWTFGQGNIGQNLTVTLGTWAVPVPDASLIVGTGVVDPQTRVGTRSNGFVVMKNGTVNIPSGNLQLGSQPALTAATATSAGFLNNATATTAGYLKIATASAAGFLTSATANSSGFLKKTGVGAAGTVNSILSLGNSAYAGDDSVSIGKFSNAPAGGNFSLGMSTEASGGHSIALQGGKAYGYSSFAALGAEAGNFQGLAIGGSDGVYESSNGLNFVGSNTVIGANGVAIGGLWNSAEGDYSYAMGRQAFAFGTDSYAHGVGVAAGPYDTVFGSRNRWEFPESITEWIEDTPIFEIGNGKPSELGNTYYPSSYNPDEGESNALTTLKNGQTTLTNKAWKANPTAPLADPASTTDSGGEALVVEGHTRLKGKVVIEQAQGDISMGIYGN